jgi:hypothetical protein
MARCAARGKVWRVTFCALTPTFTEMTSPSPQHGAQHREHAHIGLGDAIGECG